MSMCMNDVTVYRLYSRSFHFDKSDKKIISNCEIGAESVFYVKSDENAMKKGILLLKLV